ncbi:MAG: cytochrome c biogenesis protein CcsA [Bacteroidetes bacterium]|nr:cytochrome c biogenesis protein CcsA [Bacteroidota bacterium]
MEYVGEHLWIGKLGNIFVILSFVLALLASVSYFFASRDNDDAASWKRIARISFRAHGLAVFGIVATLFFMLMNHYFEYEYVWHHSNKEMPMRYILSCFWEGQEGSFLLWTFWHVLIGLILQRSAKNFEAPVMTVISLVQAFLASMLLGIFIFEYRIGSNPFTVLLREHPDFANIPLFKSENYLEKLDGRGLNPLLQNYWMTIHPPTLFLGFALTVVPFAYAIAGLWKRQFNQWLKPALPWTFFAVAVLGIGILMGGAWAYEALSFGGFWAWDPVENASLVPWLTLVGAAHLMLINRNEGQSLFTTFFLSILTFILILYSTFLTRSGILGESSVHAFTDLGMSGQLLLYLLFFFAMGMVLLIINWRKIPKLKEEESIWSREFWMFVGAIVLLVSSFQIIFYTSMPVWNKLFNLNKAPLKDVVTFYNNWQLPFAFIVTLLIAVGQFFKYKHTDPKQFIKKMLLSFVVSFVFTGLFIYLLNFNKGYYAILMFSSIFATVANLDYIIRVLNGKLGKAGASLAHIGFGLIMLGVLISTGKKETISHNTSGKSVESLGEDFSNNDNIVLTQGDTLPMGNYYATYIGRRSEGINVYFDVDYFTKDVQGNFQKEFSLAPLIQMNPRMGNSSEPDTRHYATFDLYSYVTYVDLETINEKKEATADEYVPAKNHNIKQGDTIFSSNAIIIFDSLSTNLSNENMQLSEEDIAVKAHLRVLDVKGQTYAATPVYLIKNNSVQPVASKVDELGLQFMFWKINPETGKIEISVQEKKSNIKDFIVMQAIIFPYINILWIGCIVMALGTLLSIWERIKKNKRTSN